MSLIETIDTYTTTGTSASIFGGADTSGLSFYGGWIYLDAMPADAEVEIIVYTYDAQDSVLRPYQTRYRNFNQIANETSFYLPFIASRQYDVRMRTTHGTNFEISWARYRQPQV